MPLPKPLPTYVTFDQWAYSRVTNISWRLRCAQPSVLRNRNGCRMSWPQWGKSSWKSLGFWLNSKTGTRNLDGTKYSLILLLGMAYLRMMLRPNCLFSTRTRPTCSSTAQISSLHWPARLEDTVVLMDFATTWRIPHGVHGLPPSTG